MLCSVLSFSVWVTVILLAQRCIFNIAPSILAAFATSSAITILGLAICLEGYTFSFANAINGLFLPKVSRMLANNSRDEILKLMIRVGRIQIYIIGLMCVGFICVGREFVRVWLGNGFEEVYPCALLIILPSFLQLPQEIGNTMIVAEGKVKLQAFAFLFMAALNLGLAYPLMRQWGVIGLCVSIMIAYVARTIIMDIIFYRHMHIDVLKFFRESYIKIFPFLVLTTACSWILNIYIHLTGWTDFIIKAILCMALYICVIWSFAMNTDEKNLFVSPLQRAFKIK